MESPYSGVPGGRTSLIYPILNLKKRSPLRRDKGGRLSAALLQVRVLREKELLEGLAIPLGLP